MRAIPSGLGLYRAESGLRDPNGILSGANGLQAAPTSNGGASARPPLFAAVNR
ncbi:hypothetical protein [Paenibacillus sp. GCM10023250]|uniref:hypothetical protein n=1 Tax=Paenibacillus sp. GCM10023250 TaxID=3252648 RepID=UPI003620FDF1